MKPADPMAPAEDAEDAPTILNGLLGFQLRRAHTLFALHWQHGFRDQPVRITPVQGGMLLVIDSRPGLSQVELARVMDVEGPTMVQAVDRLEANGLVQRIRRVEDRRAYSLQLTEAGDAALGAVKAFVPHRETELLCDLSEDEREVLLSLLKRVVRRAHVVADGMVTGPDAAAVRTKASKGSLK